MLLATASFLSASFWTEAAFWSTLRSTAPICSRSGLMAFYWYVEKPYELLPLDSNSLSLSKSTTLRRTAISWMRSTELSVYESLKAFSSVSNVPSCLNKTVHVWSASIGVQLPDLLI
jgi:hypothetical protein